jgi:hypothetical protein
MNDNSSQNGQWIFSQIKHLVKIVNVIIIKWAILSTMFYNIPTYLPTNRPRYLGFLTYLPTYLPICILT